MKRTELTLNLLVSASLIIYLLSFNPSTVQFVKTQLQWARWYAWSARTPAWLKEALQVRGQI